MADDRVVRFPAPGTVEDPLSALLRAGARQLLAQAVEAELAELLAAYRERRDGQGRAAVVRNGYLPEREVLTGVGPVKEKKGESKGERGPKRR